MEFSCLQCKWVYQNIIWTFMNFGSMLCCLENLLQNWISTLKKQLFCHHVLTQLQFKIVGELCLPEPSPCNFASLPRALQLILQSTPSFPSGIAFWSNWQVTSRGLNLDSNSFAWQANCKGLSAPQSLNILAVWSLNSFQVHWRHPNWGKQSNCFKAQASGWMGSLPGH